MVKFMKTRMIYYDNNINSLNESNRENNITISTASVTNNSSGYAIARLPGNIHNWSIVPFNKYGLYLSENEMYYLYNSSSKLIPKHMKVNLGHCVPIAIYPGTTNTTQLSFNNTIYSLIYELHDLENVNTQNDFESTDVFTSFRQTYDGASYTDNSRNNLPKPDLIYKFPDYILPGNVNSELNTVKVASGSTQLPTSVAVPTNVDRALTRRQMAYEFLPEFLKDNNNVYVLYPGENQYEYSESIGPSDFVCINTMPQMFNEAQNITDIRGGYHMNSDTRFKGESHLYQEVVPRVRYDGFLPATNDDPNPNNINIDVKRRLDQYYNQDEGSLCDRGPTKIFIKGNPILDNANNLVSHTFQALITWTLEIDIVPRIEPIPRHLIEGFAILRKEYYRVAGNTTVTNKFSFSKPYPMKPQSLMLKSKPSHKNRLINSNNVNDAGYSTSATDNGTWEYNPVQFQRGSGDTNTIIESENFNRTTMPSTATIAMDATPLAASDTV